MSCKEYTATRERDGILDLNETISAKAAPSHLCFIPQPHPHCLPPFFLNVLVLHTRLERSWRQENKSILQWLKRRWGYHEHGPATRINIRSHFSSYQQIKKCTLYYHLLWYEKRIQKWIDVSGFRLQLPPEEGNWWWAFNEIFWCLRTNHYSI